MDKRHYLTDGILKNNPTFRLVLGTCPTLAVTTSLVNGLAMGLCTTFVLIFSNALISLLRKVIPDKVRIPAYVLIIATFVTAIEMIVKKFLPSLNDSLGLFIPLIVVNCIILARAEAFASMNTVGKSVLDGIGIGIGFTLSLTILGLVREFLGAAAFLGMPIEWLEPYAMTIFILPAGGFLIYGIMMVLFNYVFKKIQKRSIKKEVIVEDGI